MSVPHVLFVVTNTAVIGPKNRHPQSGSLVGEALVEALRQV